jgi:hypothetical protein
MTNSLINPMYMGVIMLIKSLKKMEEIVKNDKSLSWRGWDVVHRTPNPTAWSKPDGAFHKGRWYTQKIFAVSTEGWEIPNKFVR